MFCFCSAGHETQSLAMLRKNLSLITAQPRTQCWVSVLFFLLENWGCSVGEHHDTSVWSQLDTALASAGYRILYSAERVSWGLFCICTQVGFTECFQITKGLPDRSAPARHLCFLEGSRKQVWIVGSQFRARKSGFRESALIAIIWGH